MLSFVYSTLDYRLNKQQTTRGTSASNLRETLREASSSELLHGAESPDSADGISASALSALSTDSAQQSIDSKCNSENVPGNIQMTYISVTT